jgi:hypothetical protein
MCILCSQIQDVKAILNTLIYRMNKMEEAIKQVNNENAVIYRWIVNTFQLRYWNIHEFCTAMEFPQHLYFAVYYEIVIVNMDRLRGLLVYSRVRFPALPDFLSSSGSRTGSTQSREDK